MNLKIAGRLLSGAENAESRRRTRNCKVGLLFGAEQEKAGVKKCNRSSEFQLHCVHSIQYTKNQKTTQKPYRNH